VTRYRGLVTLLKGRVVTTHAAGYVKLTPLRSKRLTAAAVPVEALAPLVLTVNATAARTMGLAMPRSLLARADVLRA